MICALVLFWYYLCFVLLPAGSYKLPFTVVEYLTTCVDVHKEVSFKNTVRSFYIYTFFPHMYFLEYFKSIVMLT